METLALFLGGGVLAVSLAVIAFLGGRPSPEEIDLSVSPPFRHIAGRWLLLRCTGLAVSATAVAAVAILVPLQLGAVASLGAAIALGTIGGAIAAIGGCYATYLSLVRGARLSLGPSPRDPDGSSLLGGVATVGWGIGLSTVTLVVGFVLFGGDPRPLLAVAFVVAIAGHWFSTRPSSDPTAPELAAGSLRGASAATEPYLWMLTAGTAAMYLVYASSTIRFVYPNALLFPLVAAATVAFGSLAGVGLIALEPRDERPGSFLFPLLGGGGLAGLGLLVVAGSYMAGSLAIGLCAIAGVAMAAMIALSTRSGATESGGRALVRLGAPPALVGIGLVVAYYMAGTGTIRWGATPDAYLGMFGVGVLAVAMASASAVAMVFRHRERIERSTVAVAQSISLDPGPSRSSPDAAVRHRRIGEAVPASAAFVAVLSLLGALVFGAPILLGVSPAVFSSAIRLAQWPIVASFLAGGLGAVTYLMWWKSSRASDGEAWGAGRGAGIGPRSAGLAGSVFVAIGWGLLFGPASLLVALLGYSTAILVARVAEFGGSTPPPSSPPPAGAPRPPSGWPSAMDLRVIAPLLAAAVVAVGGIGAAVAAHDGGYGLRSNVPATDPVVLSGLVLGAAFPFVLANRFVRESRNGPRWFAVLAILSGTVAIAGRYAFGPEFPSGLVFGALLAAVATVGDALLSFVARRTVRERPARPPTASTMETSSAAALVGQVLLVTLAGAFAFGLLFAHSVWGLP